MKPDLCSLMMQRRNALTEETPEDMESETSSIFLNLAELEESEKDAMEADAHHRRRMTFPMSHFTEQENVLVEAIAHEHLRPLAIQGGVRGLREATRAAVIHELSSLRHPLPNTHAQLTITPSMLHYRSPPVVSYNPAKDEVRPMDLTLNTP
jgi:hypothetical protein